nr:hypothetical protein [Bacteroides thetaiotaomicron]
MTKAIACFLLNIAKKNGAKAAAAAKDVMDLGVYEYIRLIDVQQIRPAEPAQSIPHIMKYIAMPIIQKVGKTLTRSILPFCIQWSNRYIK